jgi:hypothetical protein
MILFHNIFAQVYHNSFQKKIIGLLTTIFRSFKVSVRLYNIESYHLQLSFYVKTHFVRKFILTRFDNSHSQQTHYNKNYKKWKHLCQHFGRAARVHHLPVGCTQVLPPFYRNGLPPNAKIVFAELLCPHVAHLLLHFTLSLMFWDNFFTIAF